MRERALISIFLFFVPIRAAGESCYRACDLRFSECYSDCGRDGSCRFQCGMSRFTCLDPCIAGPTPLESRVLALTNAERANAGLPQLQWNPRLARAARGHADNMARQGRMAHALDGATPGDRVRRRGYSGRWWAENLFSGWGSGHNTPEASVDWWMNSTSHRLNLMNPRLTEIGIGIRLGPDGKTYYCQNFGAP